MGNERTTSLAKLSPMEAKQLFLMSACSVPHVVVAPVSAAFNVAIGFYTRPGIFHNIQIIAKVIAVMNLFALSNKGRQFVLVGPISLKRLLPG